MPRPDGRGEADGMTAGRGIDGAGEHDRRFEGEALPKEDLLLCDVGGGGFIGRAREAGVPGAEGAGDPAAWDDASDVRRFRLPRSGGAGLLDVLLRAGRSILLTRPCWERENWPSVVFKA